MHPPIQGVRSRESEALPLSLIRAPQDSPAEEATIAGLVKKA
jgi:hypothetical protein